MQGGQSTHLQHRRNSDDEKSMMMTKELLLVVIENWQTSWPTYTHTERERE